jgi:hypothetical protein
MDNGAAQQGSQVFSGRDTQAINAQPVEIGGMEIGVEEVKRRNTGEKTAGVSGEEVNGEAGIDAEVIGEVGCVPSKLSHLSNNPQAFISLSWHIQCKGFSHS